MAPAQRRANTLVAPLALAACLVSALGLAAHFTRRRTIPADPPPTPSAAPSYVIHEDFDPFRGLHDDEAVAARSNAFSVALFRAARKPGENAFVVTTGVRSALSMVALGARGETRAELSRVLGLPDGDEAIVRESGGELSALGGEGELATARVGSRLFVHGGVPLLGSFVAATGRGWKSPAVSVDFRGDVEAARARVASEIARRTGDATQASVAAGAVALDTEALLVSAAGFTTSWRVPFASDQTRDQPFAAPKGPVVAAMMRVRGDARWAREPRRQLVSLETSSGLSLLLVLPQPPHDLDRAVADLDAQDCGAPRAGQGGDRVDIALPRLRFEAASDLVEPLRKVGLARTFSPDAELPGISDHAKGPVLRGLLHAARFALDEAGIGPGATWSAEGRFGVPPPQARGVLRFDRPFLFVLCAWRTKRIVAIGQVVDPTRGL